MYLSTGNYDNIPQSYTVNMVMGEGMVGGGIFKTLAFTLIW